MQGLPDTIEKRVPDNRKATVIAELQVDYKYVVPTDNHDGTWDIVGTNTPPSAPAPTNGPPGPTPQPTPAPTPGAVSASPHEQLFVSKAPDIMQKLIDKFGFTPVQAAGVLGNIGLECDGFHQMLEIGGGGGLGWAQWTGPRRTLFENWCARNGVATGSDAGNQGYLEEELSGSQSRAVTETKQATTLASAVRVFMNTFEVPNAAVAHEDRRDQWAQLALAAYQAQHP